MVIRCLVYTLLFWNISGLHAAPVAAAEAPFVLSTQTWWQEARQAYQKKDYQQVQRLLLPHLNKPEATTELYQLLAENYLAQEQKIQALSVLQQGLEHLSNPTQRVPLLLLRHQIQGLDKQDLVAFWQDRFAADNLPQVFNLVMATEDTEPYEKAFLTAAKAELLKGIQNKDNLLLLRALRAFDSLALDGVLQRRYRFLLEDLWEAHPEQSTLRNYVVRDYLRAESYEFLMAFYRQELQARAASWSKEQKARAFGHIADVHFKLGYLSFALNNYDRVLELAPLDVSARKRRAMIYLSQNQLKEARKVLQELFEGNPLDVETRYLLALIYAYQKNPEGVQRLTAGVKGPAHLREALELARLQPRPPAELWKLLVSDPKFFNSHTAL